MVIVTNALGKWLVSVTNALGKWLVSVTNACVYECTSPVCKVINTPTE